MSTGTRIDPVQSANFRISLMESSSTTASAVLTISLGSVLAQPVGGFAECSGLDMSLDVQEHMEGGNNGTVLKFPTRAKSVNLTLRRGLTSSTDLWDWYYGFVQGQGRRRDGVIAVLDGAGKTHTVWGFRRGIPVKYAGPQLNAKQSSVAIESMEIAHEGLYQMAGASELAGAVSAAAGAIASLF